jgi:hypothetical protein
MSCLTVSVISFSTIILLLGCNGRAEHDDKIAPLSVSTYASEKNRLFIDRSSGRQVFVDKKIPSKNVVSMLLPEAQGYLASSDGEQCFFLSEEFMFFVNSSDGKFAKFGWKSEVIRESGSVHVKAIQEISKRTIDFRFVSGQGVDEFFLGNLNGGVPEKFKIESGKKLLSDCPIVS